MDIKELAKRDRKELERNLAESRNKLAKMRFDISAKQIKNHREIRKVKKDIARILTILKSHNM
ncbi:MAG: 50S ribosomal protein L29 [Candidatus Moranbacteria bacterium CG_4_10_14_3_um_filter_44_15]|nr:MAG: 50S ribosomal protein L29 [Candidatus Moranbacteria bacterium CG06_land_8_20_14_3_00_43_56]PIV84064.1 MAG: 50S ribosomal protein L29 [Candidatus Moranbacteria bacterium CG17_big_fil_post_rev_8_21_14_2_50_44_12]PIW93436.1 MAG: 50S ribosomal protein L29 [Candidatus Moranbacteria bacterium CG_4_8_14_3_um_filter_43_15]PIX90806.1 MAG: 50S ribosomal protein L29 [Candidatus Moranbacteria bacterium CG_4_10_14_3_um_filter_44_15]PJA86241.1 MAG: 50S ribosomal protein L29 [Candidatus Moranbacteria 